MSFEPVLTRPAVGLPECSLDHPRSESLPISLGPANPR